MNNKSTSLETVSVSLNQYLKTDIAKGLSETEVVERQKLFGLNEIEKQKRKNFFQLFVSQLCELMSLLLFVSGIIALALSIYENTEYSKDSGEQKYFTSDFPASIILNYIQSGILLLIVFVNALFGAWQEQKSNNAIDALQKMSSLKAKVLRDGQVILIDSSLLTVGDIIVVEAGDVIPADAKILEASNLKVVESILTGESLPIDKIPTNDVINKSESPIGERMDELFANCNVVNGRAVAIVTGIGSNTEIGKIATLLKNKKEQMSPLQLKLHNLGKVIGYIGITLTFITFIFVLFVLEGVISVGIDALTPSIILAVSVAAAAVPEGLNAVVNVVLAVGVNKMAKRNGLIKKLTSVETLGSTAVICSDKTGTLTMNKMTIVKMYAPGEKEQELSKIDKLPKKYFELLRYATLCTDCSVADDGSENGRIGDPTELAIVDLALERGYSDDEWDAKYKRLADIPFDSDRKLMTSINKIDGKIYAIVKGAPDVLLSRCKSNSSLKEAKVINNEWSDNANRVLAVGVKELKSVPAKLDQKKIESDLTFIGLVGMIDPPREEVKRSILECLSAGIKPVMITGDHLNTAIAIAKDLHIYKDDDIAITGTDLDKMTDAELANKIEKISVYARVSPENKIRIVNAWQSKDQVVSMTGDGVNDAPALKAADIGCAMGITGTDVSKGAADMILTDDNFSTIVESVKLGRSIYENIRRIILFLLSSNVAWLFTIVLGIFIMYFVFDPKFGGWGTVTATDIISWNIPVLNDQKNAEAFANTLNENIKFNSLISAILILINNLVVETIPGIALGLKDTNENLMNKRPRSKFESVFAEGLIKKIWVVGAFIGLLSLVAFTLGAYTAIALNRPGLRFFYGSCAAFIFLSFCGVAKSIWLSSKSAIIKAHWKDVRSIVYSCVVSIVLILIVTLIPQVNSYFGLRPDIDSFVWGENINSALKAELIKEENFKLIKTALDSNLFGNETVNSMLNGYVWLNALGFSILVFVFLELYKFIDNKYLSSKHSEEIKEFKLIPRPTPWYEKNKFINNLYSKFTRQTVKQ